MSKPLRRGFGLLILLSLMLTGACNRSGNAEAEGDQPGSVQPDMQGAQEIFSQRCVTCHGETGQGNGPASVGLETHPRNFTDAAWQSEVSDEHIERIIVQGGAAVGRSAAMPNNPDLRGRPEVVAGLRVLIRSFGSE